MPPNLSRQEFLEYILAFNLADYKKQHSFYTKDVTLTLPDPAIPTIHGSEGILKHYAPLHDKAIEKIVPMVLMNEDDKIFYMMESYFRFKKPTNMLHGFDVKEGDVVKITCSAYYKLEGKKMKSILCGLYKQEHLGQVDLAPLIEESQSRAESDLRINIEGLS